MADKDYDLGVLFVHGMGEQRRGDTLTEMGEAVAHWLRRRFAAEQQDPAITRAILRDDSDEPSGVAEFAVSFDGIPIDPAGPSTEPVRWLLQESRWAETFRPATFVETMLWAISVGPWLMAYQFDGVRSRIQRSGKTRPNLGVRLLRTAVGVVLGIASAVAAAVLTPLAIVVTVLSLLPIPFVQGLAQAAQRNLAGSYGDLSVLVRSPLRFAAMWSRVVSDIDTLESRCDTVAVVAHSQGSAVSWQALRRLKQGHAHHGQSKSVRVFVSFGQALRKLKMLYLISTEATVGEKSFMFISALVSTIALVAVTANIVLIATFGPREIGLQVGNLAVPRLVLLVIYLGMVFVIQLVLARHVRKWSDRTEQEIIKEIDEMKGTEFEWVDVWASADPAPNGELLRDPSPVADRVSSYKVRNLGSTVLDHIVYWKNDTEFVTAVIHAISARSERRPLLIREKAPAALAGAVRHRHFWVDLLVAARFSYFLTAVTFAIVAHGLFSIVGNQVGGWIQLIPFVAEDFTMPGWAAGIAGLALYAVVAVLGWLLVISKIWNALLGAEADKVLVGSAPRMPSLAANAWIVGLAIGVVGFAVWLLFSHGRIALFIYGVLMIIGLFVVVGTLGGGGAPVAKPEPLEPREGKPEAEAVPSPKDEAANSLAI